MTERRCSSPGFRAACAICPPERDGNTVFRRHQVIGQRGARLVRRVQTIEEEDAEGRVLLDDPGTARAMSRAAATPPQVVDRAANHPGPEDLSEGVLGGRPDGGSGS